ncbi:GreA/GreB family elongation factor [Microvirga sp. 2TAF3]|uniref:GreA/GreB family elongation factor n=1 Tax=Microvirga sp. 2TAF3 TaxID=3233014 RepID=UPI003F9D6BAC
MSPGRLLRHLVYLSETDGEADRVSVLTPVGAALIGLREGQSITWRTPKGWQQADIAARPYGRFVEPWREVS